MTRKFCILWKSFTGHQIYGYYFLLLWKAIFYRSSQPRCSVFTKYGLLFYSKAIFWEFLIPDRSNHRSCSIKKSLLKNFAKFTGKHPWQSLFFSKIAYWGPQFSLKKRISQKCFPVNFEKSFKRPWQNISGQLLLSWDITFENIHRKLVGHYKHCHSKIRCCGETSFNNFKIMIRI